MSWKTVKSLNNKLQASGRSCLITRSVFIEKIKLTLLVCWLKSQTLHNHFTTLSMTSDLGYICSNIINNLLSNLEPNPEAESSWQIFWCLQTPHTAQQKQSSHKLQLAGRSPGQHVTSLFQQASHQKSELQQVFWGTPPEPATHTGTQLWGPHKFQHATSTLFQF